MIVEWLPAWSRTVVLNVIPAFMPPTWSLLAYFHLSYAFPILPLAAVGATAATTGRGLLALASRAFGARFLSKGRQENLRSLTIVLRQRKAVSVPLLLLFVLGPVPSNELFIAAGLAKAPLLPLLVIFGLARFVSYLLWVKTTATVARSLWDIVTPGVGSELALAAQIFGLLLLIALVRIDWTRVLQRWMPIESQLQSK